MLKDKFKKKLNYTKGLKTKNINYINEDKN
jgi:hypothetical protein